MCGFGGVLNAASLISREKLSGIASAVSHRGPDNTGLALFEESLTVQGESGPHAVFFNRLAIIDLDARSDQPFQDDQHLLIFNGEIYNFQEIKKELSGKGIVFKTSSDTEVLFFALKIWGQQTLLKLNGMFAFFWLDKTNKTFLLARDRTGIKPIYYKLEDGTFIFASEMDTVVRFSNRNESVSRTSVRDYLFFQYVPTPNTILENVHKLEPGHFISGSIQGLKSKNELLPSPYWDGYKDMAQPTGNAESKDLEQLLVDSIRGQLVADVPLGLFLSSGVDSSLLTALINKHFRGRPYDFFTVAFDRETTSDESAQALRYLKGFENPDLRHHTLTVSPGFICSRLESLYNYYDEPFGDPAALLNMAISQKAREHVTVALSGDGADELFWGYPRYGEWRRRMNSMLPGSIRHLFKLLPRSRTKYTLMNLVEKDPIRAYLNLVSPRMFGSLAPQPEDQRLWFLEGISALKERNDLPAIIDLKTYLPDAMLYKVDRSSMAVSLEVRVPYLDNHVVARALGLSIEEKSNSKFENKAPLKNLLAKLAPQYEVHSPKRGFSFPLDLWLKKEWSTILMDHLTKENLVDVGLEPSCFMKITDQYRHGNTKFTMEVWHLLNLVLWHAGFKAKRLKSAR